MAATRVLVTPDYLRPGDEADTYLRRHGHDVRHVSLLGRHDPAELVAALDGVDAVLAGHEAYTADVLAAAPRLRVVVRAGVGYDNVDVEAAARAGVVVCNLPGVNANAVAEYTVGLLLTAARHLVASAASVRDGGWLRADGHELRGATLGLVGHGATARALVPLARAFGMTVLCTSGVPEHRREPGVRFVGLPDLLAGSDYVSLHTALTPRTRHLVDAAALRLMRPTAVLVNTARGGLVDEPALADAVRSGRLAGAVLDVVAEEPLPAASPLRDVPGITVLSHLAGQTAEARAATGRDGAAEVVRALAGRPASGVNAHLLPDDLPV